MVVLPLQFFKIPFLNSVEGGFAQTLNPTKTSVGTRDFRFDFNAKGRIVGTVKRKNDPTNIPLSRRVRLYRDVDGMLVQETWSDDGGNYVFNYIEENMAYTAISYDHTHHHRATAADNLTLANGGVEIMP